MIQAPRRSVTRFLIPFIDVLILLFCIFLLMPFVSSPTSDKGDQSGAESRDPSLPDSVEQLQAELAAMRLRVDEMKKQRLNLSDRLSVRVLEIDKDNGKLQYFDSEAAIGRQYLRDQADAQRLINQQRARAGARDVFFLILYPRELTGYPLRQQIETYRRWFKDVAFGFDNPWSSSQP